MAQSSRTTKAVSTIQECVADLKKSFFTEHTLINDDDAALHRLEEKLELVLTIGLKEKPGVFGGKKSYWDYICACLSSSKRSHPALKFVKTISEIKTSVGRGRAFIRFCLMHNCLADTLQSCFVDIKTTREFYSELSIPLLPKLWSSLVACLYDLNEIHFDLNLQNAELDVSWPSFARKLFVSAETDVASGRNLISNVPHLLMEDKMSISSESLSTENEEVSNGAQGIFSQNIPDYEKIKDNFHQINSPRENDPRAEPIRKELNSNVKEKSQCVCICDFDNSLCNTVKTLHDVDTLDPKASNSASKLIIEMKELTENLSNSMCKYSKNFDVVSNFARLKHLVDYFEVNYLAEIEKAQEFKAYVQHSEKLAGYLKYVALKQNTLIDSLSEQINSSFKENESLFEKLNSLKDRLHSFGLLKNTMDCKPNTQINSLISNKPFHADVNLVNEEFAIELSNFPSINSLDSVNIFKESLSKLNNLNNQAISLQSCLNNSCTLNDSLISRVQDHEIHMKGITKELEEAHKLLSVMREQHQKLQSAENIVKYDLQEKRKLLTRLKQQLESTHEDCKQVRIKNSKSKSEWESLRKEFTLRTKQTSEESGFIDESSLEDQCAVTDTSFHENEIISNNDICKNVDDKENKYILKSNRLQMLEEQCKLLCSNLINSSKKREEIDCKLESWCKAIEKSHENAQPEKMSDNISEAQSELKSEIVEVVSEEEVDSGSPLLSSGIGSVNSECVFISNDCSELSNNISCTSTPLENNSLNLSSISDFVSHQSESLLEIDPDTKSKNSCTEYIEGNSQYMEVASHSGSMNSLKVVENRLPNTSDSNSKNYEDCVFDETFSSATKKSIAQETEIRKLREEIAALETKVQELEKTSIMLSSQLALKTQQLKLTETAKEQEITALQFQLNSEVLKYERALKEFTMNNSGLNEMKQKVNDQEELVLALEEALAEIQAEREHEKDHQWEDLQDIQLALVAREEECRLLSEDLKKMDDFKKYCLNDKEAMESEIINLRDNEKELQKKVIKLLKEKDILWQRNDHLAFLQKIRIDDRWMNDSEVSKCLGCSSNFSFLLRKHHCRQCGRIFCHSCSNTWLPSASSKKLIRICNECYKQHLDIKKVVRRDSNVQCCEDSEDESTADTESFSLHRRYMLENRPSLAESIVSLPVMQETSLPPKCNFTSVPQLYIADENQQASDANPINPDLTSQLKTTSCEKTEEDLLINAGEEAEIPILCKKKGTSLHWKLTPNDEAIPITLIYEDSISTSQQTIVHHSSCETAGVIHLKINGLYKFRFDNSSRSTLISLNYILNHSMPEEIEDI